MDGATLRQIKNEIEGVALGARVDRIAQPTREELILHLRWRGGSGKLLLSAGANSARVHFTENVPENPKTPPMFCMLLRKHLLSAKLLAVRQFGMDRILFLDFEAQNELGDIITITIACEIMGRHSNIIAITQEGKVIDSIKRVDFETSRVRQILPGIVYELPPAQNKLSIVEITSDEIIARMKNGRDIELSKAIMEILQGMSPLPCREIAHYATRGVERVISELSDDEWLRLRFMLEQASQSLRDNTAIPVMVTEPEPSGRPRDFSFMQINQYGAAMATKQYESFSILLDAFYARRDLMERQKQRSLDLLKLIANTSDRIARKLAAQKEELAECAQRETLRIYGDLITANIHLIQKGDNSAVLQNYYDPNYTEIEIPLDIRLTPAQNAQRYYAQYRKADTAEKMLHKLVEQGEAELLYIESVFDVLTRAETAADLDAIRAELAQGGYVRAFVQKGRNKKEEKLAPLRFVSTDGFTILTGRNNIQNDRLTLRESRGNDIWLHTQKIPGSHTIILSQGVEVPKSTIEQACIIAAYHSKARESSKVPVDFTQVRNVKKPNGAKPGMVIYDHYETVIIDPDEDLVKRLAAI